MSPHEKIALGECQSDRGVDHCPYCTDSCDAAWHKHNIKELSELKGSTSDAEATVKFAILSGMVDAWGKPHKEIRDAIFQKLFQPDLKWAIVEYLKKIEKPL